MCGVAGFICGARGMGGGAETSTGIVESMVRRLLPRGPDAHAVHRAGRAVLGHTRLAVIDLEGGAQPFSSSDGRYTIVFAGEIYNYVELRAELASGGVQFRTRSDTEVLLAAYIAWGERALSRFVGPFAFAIWDAVEERLFLARDRLGVRPLIWLESHGGFAFASELDALVQGATLPVRLDPEAVALYWMLGYIPAPYCVLRGPQKLLPGHFLVLEGDGLRVERYWYPERAQNLLPADRRERLGQLRELFRDAVRLRLRSDVPVALFLSGGVDSASVTAEVAEVDASTRALAVVFDGDTVDLPYAEECARQLGVPLDVTHVARQVTEAFDRVVAAFDEPFADSSSLPTWLLGRTARGVAKVVLTGDGGDELFAGYPHYVHIASKQWLKRLACSLGLRDGDARSPVAVYLASKALFRVHEARSLLGEQSRPDALRRWIDRQPFLRDTEALSPLRRALWIDRHLQLADGYLVKVDIALSEQGIESRSPFLDHRLVEWANELPEADLVRGREKKIILRDAFRGRLSERVLDRAKHGFGAPVARWLSGELEERWRAALPCELLDEVAQRRVIAAFERKPDARNAQRLWMLFVFASWARLRGARW